MKRLTVIIIGIGLVWFPCQTASAVPFGDGGQALQSMLDEITTAPIAGESHIKALVDELLDSFDSTWTVTATAGPLLTIVAELAQWSPSNLFGVYDAADPSTKVQLFDGSAGSGSMAKLSIKLDGSVLVNFADTGVDFKGYNFGFYLDSRAGDPAWTGGVWHSHTNLNADGQDHMAAYQGKNIDTVQMPGLTAGLWTENEYLLAFEDLHSMHWGNQNGTNEGYPEWWDTEPDYTDFVVMIQGATPIPEPATVLILSLGGVLTLRRKR